MVGFAQYSIMTLYVAHFISYGVSITVLSMLSWAFFAWYRSSHNSMVLVFALSSFLSPRTVFSLSLISPLSLSILLLL